ncbi:MAG: hypothetical protein ACLT3L_05700, partial [Clostridium sp.]
LISIQLQKTKRHYLFLFKLILKMYFIKLKIHFIKWRVGNLTKARIVYIIQWSLLPEEVKCRWLKI